MTKRGRSKPKLSERLTVPMTPDLLRVVQETAEQRKLPAAEMVRRILEAHLCEDEDEKEVAA